MRRVSKDRNSRLSETIAEVIFCDLLLKYVFPLQCFFFFLTNPITVINERKPSHIPKRSRVMRAQCQPKDNRILNSQNAGDKRVDWTTYSLPISKQWITEYKILSNNRKIVRFRSSLYSLKGENTCTIRRQRQRTDKYFLKAKGTTRKCASTRFY